MNTHILIPIKDVDADLLDALIEHNNAKLISVDEKDIEEKAKNFNFTDNDTHYYIFGYKDLL